MSGPKTALQIHNTEPPVSFEIVVKVQIEMNLRLSEVTEAVVKGKAVPVLN
jgi:hypothetical protein